MYTNLKKNSAINFPYVLSCSNISVNVKHL